MAHEESHAHLSPEEKKFRFYMTRGEDFMRCEIYRNAKKYYQMALDMNMENDTVSSKIANCDVLIKQEGRTIIKILISAVLIVGIVLFIRSLM